MKHLILFLTLIGFLLLFLGAVGPSHAAECEIFAQYMGPCSRTVEMTQAPSEMIESSPFTTPGLPENTLFGRRWYGRLADNTLVYASPSRAAAQLRNVGDGYLFATILRRLQNENGETWYEINRGEFVHADDIQPAEASDFQGVETTRQPQRPFGWVVQEVRPSRVPDGEPDLALEKLDRFTQVEIYDAVQGEDD